MPRYEIGPELKKELQLGGPRAVEKYMVGDEAGTKENAAMNDVTSTYRVEIFCKGYQPLVMSWHLKKAGWPSDEALAAFIERVEKTNDMVCSGAEIIRQHTKEVVATFTPAALDIATPVLVWGNWAG